MRAWMVFCLVARGEKQEAMCASSNPAWPTTFEKKGPCIANFGVLVLINVDCSC